MREPVIDRRRFLGAGAAALLATGSSSVARASGSRPPRILLRSSWQTVNIGDIAHTPGVLRLLEQFLPGVEVTLWPSSVADGVAAMLARRFPKVEILRGKEAVAGAFRDCDFLLHGSGPSLVAEKDVRRWVEETGKPFGVYGITLANPSTATIALLNQARFVFYRDSVSLKLAKERGCVAPVQEFGPDGAFAVDLADDPAADAFLKTHGLVPGKFLCCIPRLRNTPYWKIKPNTPFDPAKHARNEQLKEHDHAPLREAITRVVRETDLRVLICPEDKSQMEVGREMLLEKLPEDVRKRVVYRERFWLTDEALSTYKRSAGLFGNEMHSPIMCVGNGIPALVCRFAEQTSKGFMWRDIGLGDWLFDLDRDEDLPRIAPAVLEMARNPAAARDHIKKAHDYVRVRQIETMDVLRRSLSGAL